MYANGAHKCLLAALLLGVVLCALPQASQAAGWEKLDEVLRNGIHSHTTPGLQALVADKNGIIYHKTFGNYTYGEPTTLNRNNPPVKFSTIFDMASLTKVLATTTSAMILYDKGLLNLDMRISDPTLLGPSFSQNGKETITVRNLLLHDSGFPPDPVPGYGAKDFDCPETRHYHPGLSFTCVPQIYHSVMKQTLQNPVGAVYVYSDLSMITLAFALGKIAKDNGVVHSSELQPACTAVLANEPAYHCYFEALMRIHVAKKLGMAVSGFNLPMGKYASATPTWNDTTWRHELLQGVVSDENAYAAGGYAGHAGFWSTTTETYLLTKALMFGGNSFVKQSTVDLWTKAYNLTQSSRALGWDTNDYKMNTYRGCATLSSKTYTHLGYTGTETCNDPERQLITILLTNRVYPGKTNSADLIHSLRQNFNTAVQQIYDSGRFTTEIKEVERL